MPLICRGPLRCIMYVLSFCICLHRIYASIKWHLVNVSNTWNTGFYWSSLWLFCRELSIRYEQPYESWKFLVPQKPKLTQIRWTEACSRYSIKQQTNELVEYLCFTGRHHEPHSKVQKWGVSRNLNYVWLLGIAVYVVDTSASLGFMSHSRSQISLTRLEAVVQYFFIFFLPLFHWSARTSQKGGSAKKNPGVIEEKYQKVLYQALSRGKVSCCLNQVFLGKGRAWSADAPSKFEWWGCKYSWLHVPAWQRNYYCRNFTFISTAGKS
jgi:hypothetical protein